MILSEFHVWLLKDEERFYMGFDHQLKLFGMYWQESNRLLTQSEEGIFYLIWKALHANTVLR